MLLSFIAVERYEWVEVQGFDHYKVGDFTHSRLLVLGTAVATHDK